MVSINKKDTLRYPYIAKIIENWLLIKGLFIGRVIGDGGCLIRIYRHDQHVGTVNIIVSTTYLLRKLMGFGVGVSYQGLN